MCFTYFSVVVNLFTTAVKWSWRRRRSWEFEKSNQKSETMGWAMHGCKQAACAVCGWHLPSSSLHHKRPKRATRCNHHGHRLCGPGDRGQSTKCRTPQCHCHLAGPLGAQEYFGGAGRWASVRLSEIRRGLVPSQWAILCQLWLKINLQRNNSESEDSICFVFFFAFFFNLLCLGLFSKLNLLLSDNFTFVPSILIWIVSWFYVLF